MLTYGKERATKLDQARAIEPQGLEGRAAAGRQSQNLCEVATPHEVNTPELAAWVEEPGDFPGDRVCRLGSNVLVVVATLTSERKIFECGDAAEPSRLDVFD